MRMAVGMIMAIVVSSVSVEAATVATSMPTFSLPLPRSIVASLDQSNDLAASSIASYAYDDGIPNLPTAVYDISAHVVVLPDGARLEAHSGLAERADDPRFIRERMRGPTPPALYSLAPRQHPFHGIAALRLTPILGDVFGRSGLLTHTYMLHNRPESNGCVVFRDYDAFLRAYRDGRFKRLRVVPAVGDMAIRDNDA